MKPLALLVTLFVIIVPVAVFAQESVAVDPAPGFTVERLVILIGAAIVPVGNIAIWICRRNSWTAQAQWLVAKVPLVAAALAENGVLLAAAKAGAREIQKLVEDPRIQVTPSSPVSVAGKQLEKAAAEASK